MRWQTAVQGPSLCEHETAHVRTRTMRASYESLLKLTNVSSLIRVCIMYTYEFALYEFAQNNY